MMTLGCANSNAGSSKTISLGGDVDVSAEGAQDAMTVTAIAAIKKRTVIFLSRFAPCCVGQEHPLQRVIAEDYRFSQGAGDMKSDKRQENAGGG